MYYKNLNILIDLTLTVLSAGGIEKALMEYLNVNELEPSLSSPAGRVLVMAVVKVE